MSRWGSKQVRENTLGQKDRETVAETGEPSIKNPLLPGPAKKERCSQQPRRLAPQGRSNIFVLSSAKGRSPGGLAGLSAGASVLLAPLAPGPAAEIFTWK